MSKDEKIDHHGIKTCPRHEGTLSVKRSLKSFSELERLKQIDLIKTYSLRMLQAKSKNNDPEYTEAVKQEIKRRVEHKGE
jgi:hypothetical protein